MLFWIFFYLSRYIFFCNGSFALIGIFFVSMHFWLEIALAIHVFNPSFLAHLSRRLTRWAYRIGLEPASVCLCVRPLTISNMNISKTRGPIAIKFYLKHYCGGGKPALGFGPGRIRILVSMATDSSHRVIMGKTALPRFLGCFWSDPFHTCR